MRRLSQAAVLCVFAMALSAGCKRGSGGTLSGGGGGGSGSGTKKVFVTSTFFTGAQLGSLSQADSLCASHASSGGLSGTFKAWLSDASTNAIDRIADVGPWYPTAGSTAIFASKAAITSSGAAGPIVLDETGTTIGGSFPVWTGTTSTGASATNQHCTGWTVTSGTGMIGDSGGTGFTWTNNGTQSCASNAHLYCFQQ